MPTNSRVPVYRRIAIVFWILTAIAILAWSLVPGYVVGWDLRVYGNAVTAMKAGLDPYLAGIAVQKVFHATGPHPFGTPTPFTYVYSPITLPLIKLASLVPLLLSSSLYWLVYAAMTVAAVWVGLRLVTPGERAVFALLAPVAVFFPGMLQNDVLFSGNVAYILYGAALLAAWRGWQREDWKWFYLVVLLASCFKAPLLSLLAIPLFSGRRQIRWVALTAVAGVLLFAGQPLLRPELFRHYLEAVELQFSFNHDFSSSPAGLFADALFDYVPYQISSGGLYLVYAAMVSWALWKLGGRYRAGLLTTQQFGPVVLLGTLLLNPRIMEYDIAPLTLPIALLTWRFLKRGQPLWRAAFLMAVVFGALNAAAARSWRPTACVVLMVVFVAGAWDLWWPAGSRLAGRVDEAEAAA